MGVLFSLSTTDVVLHKGFNKIGGISEMQKNVSGMLFSPNNIERKKQ